MNSNTASIFTYNSIVALYSTKKVIYLKAFIFLFFLLNAITMFNAVYLLNSQWKCIYLSRI